MPKRPIDITLINLILNGNQELYEIITEEYFDIIYYHIRCIVKNHEDAQDLTNDVFVKAYKSLNLYKPEHKFGTWLYKIATNTAIDFLRKKKTVSNIQVQQQTESHEQIADNTTPESKLIDQQNYATLKDAVSKLKSNYRTIVKMRYYDELSYEEIARKLNIPIGTVKASLHRAKAILCQLIINQQK
jgi:RNA polymerase sigma-70 factor (ECF subfamily)